MKPEEATYCWGKKVVSLQEKMNIPNEESDFLFVCFEKLFSIEND